MLAGNTYKQFTRCCLEAGVGLDPRLAVDFPMSGVESCASPDGWYGAIAMAGKLLRESSDTPLVTRLVHADIVPGNSTKHRVLCCILNSTIVPDLSHDFTQLPAGAGNVLACAKAESLFSDTIEAMQAPRKVFRDDDGMIISWLILASGGEPFGITKFNGEISTLSLKPVTVAGISYPEGSILKVDTPRIRVKKAMFADESMKECVDVSQVRAASFVRLSAFAVPVNERHDFGQISRNLRLWTIPEIRGVAQMAMG